MCGRYAASRQTDDLVEELRVARDATGDPVRGVTVRPQTPPPGEPDFNVAPTKLARVVMARAKDGPPERSLRLLVWGLVPSWAKDPASGARMANARAESVLEKPAFRRAALARRCLVPVTGWYEWQASPTVTMRGRPRKQPFLTRRADGEPLTLAGLYEFWRDPTMGADDPLSWLTTFTIVTQEAEPGLDRIHDRQPVVVDPKDWDEWLDPHNTDADSVAALVSPREPGRFEAYPVSTAVNATSNNSPDLLLPAPPEELAGVLDPWTGELLG